MDDYLDGSVDTEDVFPCKGCGEILEEGKAFELSGLRWHLDCFRCNTCNTLLDSDANLLLLGDGSLICNNCTYSCNACGNKIEDLAILTGDQAFCATCFRCRNCKRKIENLRYARTSQGIFCMSCHESLMARRRKKSKAAQAKAREKDGSPAIKDKSLPALPPNAIPPNAFSNEKVSPDSDMPTELSPRPRAQYTLNESSSRDSSRPSRSPDRQEHRSERIQESIKEPMQLAPPSQNYRNNRNSSIVSGDVLGGDIESFFIPVALDSTPAPSVNSRSASGTPADPARTPKDHKDYFSVSKNNERKSDSQASTPHIAFQEKFQEKGRTPSADYESPQQPEPQRPTRRLSKRQNGLTRASPVTNDERKASGSNVSSPAEEFKLQEAPKSKKLVSNRANSQSSIAPDNGGSPNKNAVAVQRNKDQTVASTQSESPPLLGANDKELASRTSLESRGKEEREMRPSLESSNSSNNVIPRKEVPAAPARSASDANGSTAAPQHLPRPAPLEQKLSDTYMQPRAPPQVPSSQPAKEQQQQQQQSISHSKSASDPTTPKASPKLPRWSAGEGFSMDEDMARILGTDEGSSSILRRVSNAVRHGRNNSTESSSNHHMNMTRIGHSRSVSETTRMTGSPRWPRTPITEESNGEHGHDISSPISLAGVTHDDPAFLKRQLRNSEQRVAELERKFNTEKDLKNLDKKLIEKRKTVSTLDTQAELMVRQLEVLAGYVERVKETKEPIDIKEWEDEAIRELVQKLDKVRQSMTASIEELLAERDELMEEKNQAIADRDRALLEFEQLSSKNAQLADMNNDLTHQIQERFKSQIGSELKSPNGLGIYSHHSKGASNASVNLDAASLGTAHTLINTDDEPVLEGPTVVNIRKGQVRKFNWKKGGSKVASGITKGINRAAGAFQGPDQPQHRHPGLAGENIGMPYNMTVAQVDSPVSQGPNGQNRVPSETAGKGFGFFGGSKIKQPPRTMNAINMSGSIPTIAEAPTTLFGSDLVERADYERRQIPSVVTRCIEEVELRGMDIEGIYRKTGGSSQIKMVQEGFDKNEDFDISDPSIDITAVTSVLKQYFRKLPVPLLTFDVYERILESNSIAADDERCDHLRKTINMLPPKHRDCLEFLMFHLVRVASRQGENLMNPKNLAVVFAPTIMRDHSIEKEMTDMLSKNIAVQFMIEHSDTIFSDA
ncbi:hypothetical protein GE09DRAFT_1176027 [Coniochaeta sp. 2T2.1]|nr:hypothetical protein GE09DRAFT_1176027 [Coniochaeta sp. 2T2.1]